MHHSSFIRITALSIVINSASNFSESSSPFPIDTLQMLRQILPYFHTETNAKARNEYFVLVKSLNAHMRRGLTPHLKEKASHASYAKKNPIINIDNGEDSIVHVHRSQDLSKNTTFSEWFDEFLVNELHPSVSYQRHITALKAMLSVGLTRIFKNGAVDVLSPNRTDSESHSLTHEYFLGFRFIRLFLDLTMDPFDDVRSAAALLLRNLLSNVDFANRFFGDNISMNLKDHEDKISIKIALPILHDFKNIFISTIDRAKTMMSCTGRADHADGFGRLYHLNYDLCNVINTSVRTDDRISILDNLMSSLSEDITNLQSNFSLAVVSSPLHGNLIALRYFALNSSAGLASTEL